MEAIAAEKVFIYELDGGGDGDILTGGVEAEAAGMVAPTCALFVLALAGVLMPDATVGRWLQGSPDRLAHCPPDAVPFDMCSEHTLTMLNQCSSCEIE